MSRTYRNYIRLGNCGGNNTKFYKYKNKQRRVKKRNVLHKIKQIDITEFANCYIKPKEIKKDSWREPSDGAWVFGSKDIMGVINDICSSDKLDVAWGKYYWNKCVINLKYYHKNHLKLRNKNYK